MNTDKDGVQWFVLTILIGRDYGNPT